MSFCINCGEELPAEAKFCLNCGKEVNNNSNIQRKTVYDGEIHKCPNCGESTNAFAMNCATCGFEFRNKSASNTIKNFAEKIEMIESSRLPRKKFSRFSVIKNQQEISETDKQKISLINSFPVPNTKEDMLEFMILATSSINMKAYDSTDNTTSKGEKEINRAWFSKVQQIYNKAKISYSTDDVFKIINELYNRCDSNIRKAKKKNIIKWCLLVGWIPLLYIILIPALFFF